MLICTISLCNWLKSAYSIATFATVLGETKFTYSRYNDCTHAIHGVLVATIASTVAATGCSDEVFVKKAEKCVVSEWS